MDSKNLVQRAVKETDGRTRSVIAFIEKYIESDNFEISNLLREIRLQTVDADAKYEYDLTKKVIDTTINNMKNY